MHETPMLIHENHHRTVEHLIHEWARRIDENRVEAISDLLAENGRYTITSRFNHDRNLPLAIVDAHSAAQLRDRILSMRVANVYEPHHYRHMISGIQIVGGEPHALEVRSNFLVIRTMDLTGDTKLFISGQTRDVIDVTPASPRFVQRTFIFDSRAIETLLVIPL
jgi:anthranilate 1,2-dioxygenase small subunit